MEKGPILVLDEVNAIKNEKSRTFAALKELKSQFDACIMLTGSPLDNKWSDFYALYHKVGAHDIQSKQEMVQLLVHQKGNLWKAPRAKGLMAFIQILNSFMLRRPETTALARRVLSTVFPKYKSRISTVDFGAMYRNMPQRSVLVQTGISLNRSSEAPTTIWDKGQLRVQEDEQVKNARQTSDAVRATLRSKHGSLTVAARAGDPQWEVYQTAEAERKAMVIHVSTKIFRTEYKQHFESLGFTKAALSELNDAITEVDITSDVSDLPLFVAEDGDIDAYDAVLNTRNAEETPSTEEQEELEDLFGDGTGLDKDITDNIQSAEELDATLDDSRQTDGVARSLARQPPLPRKICSVHQGPLGLQ
ncbi:hypothetical protein J4E93_006840 [Alternaria ventricosa]|uniref:uncharacterized protein n=1 Tax=Alternaria ventricosa TaxID=1187951 RepID=UPI0020C339B3|nr:uncharacterized protein J4E93_006840 [Alternaria ventricosa]KAI4643827.1 hypothetical protein J4E93_006840 [Alternaria ventricosa]